MKVAGFVMNFWIEIGGRKLDFAADEGPLIRL